MKKTRILLTVLILIVLGALWRQQVQMKIVKQEVQQIETSDAMPAGIPGNSAPPFTLAACEGKSSGDECQLSEQLDSEKGICFTSGDRLACGPQID